jgi:uncharacterized membrane protein
VPAADAADFVGNNLPSNIETFAPGARSKDISVAVKGDKAYESEGAAETFSVVLSRPVAALIHPTSGTAVGRIQNDDVAPTPAFFIEAVEIDKNEGNAGTTNFSFRVTRSGDLSATNSVRWTMFPGEPPSANAADLVGPDTAVVSFNPGDAAKILNLEVKGDTVQEPNERFVIALSEPTGGATIIPSRSAVPGVIRNDDAPPPDPVASFQGLGHLAGFEESFAQDVTADGKIVVGTARHWITPQTAWIDEPFVWRSTTGIAKAITGGLGGGGVATATNFNGSVIVGDSGVTPMRIQNGNKAVRDIPSPYAVAAVSDVSNDNSKMILTASRFDIGTRPYREDDAGGWQALPIPSGYTDGEANKISADGSVIAGTVWPANVRRHLILWTNGVANAVGVPAGFLAVSARIALSANGTVVAAVAGLNLFTWSGGSWTQRTTTNGDDFVEPAAINADGSVIVGRLGSASGSTPEAAVRWTAQKGTEKIADLLSDAGVSTNGWILRQATGISADGTVIVGFGRNPLGATEAWIARIPVPSVTPGSGPLRAAFGGVRP